MIYTDDDFFEAEYKLQNTIRVTTFVEDFRVEVNTGRVWAPVTEYVAALLDYERQKAKDKLIAEGYTKTSHILYGTKYPDPRKCTKTSHFVEQEDCQCGYTKGMR